jgi:glucan endo-1,6-beta-glucosidase
VRAVELILGIPVPGAQLASTVTTSNFTSAITSVTNQTNPGSIFTDEVKAALEAAVPILVQVGLELTIPAIFNFNLASAPLHNERSPLVTK